MNKAIFTGNLTRDAELKQINGGEPFITFSVASNFKMKDKEVVDFIDCIKGGNNTGVLPYLKKGTKVLVEGRVGVRAYINKNGQAQGTLNLHVVNLELLGGNNAQTAAPQPQPLQPAQAYAPQPVQAFAPSQQPVQPQQQVLSPQFAAANNVYTGGGMREEDLPF